MTPFLVCDVEGGSILGARWFWNPFFDYSVYVMVYYLLGSELFKFKSQKEPLMINAFNWYISSLNQEFQMSDLNEEQMDEKSNKGE